MIDSSKGSPLFLLEFDTNFEYEILRIISIFFKRHTEFRSRKSTVCLVVHLLLRYTIEIYVNNTKEYVFRLFVEGNRPD